MTPHQELIAIYIILFVEIIMMMIVTITAIRVGFSKMKQPFIVGMALLIVTLSFVIASYMNKSGPFDQRMIKRVKLQELKAMQPSNGKVLKSKLHPIPLWAVILLCLMVILIIGIISMSMYISFKRHVIV
jgi:hypothetical protein